MIYIVTGIARSGTSMMMKALQRGGMKAFYSHSLERKLSKTWKTRGYNANPGGYFEAGERAFDDLQFPLQHSEKVIKILVGGLHRLAVAPEGYNFLFMLREPAEIRMSMKRLSEDNINAKNDHILMNYADIMFKFIEAMRNRRDTRSVIQFTYGEIVKEPLKHFEVLVEQGWPLDASKAASSINPALWRMRA